jgi:hypothetical protein
MRLIVILSISLFSLSFLNAQSVGIGTTSPDSSAILDVSSTTKGMLMPRMTTAQRDAIMSPMVGLSVFNLDDGCIDMFKNNSWNKLCSSNFVMSDTIESSGEWEVGLILLKYF